jgi:tetratricopeptide (TPR) repeat protein
MNRWRIGGLLVVAILAAWLVLRSCRPSEPEPPVETQPARQVFQPTTPLQIEVTAAADTKGRAPSTEWLQHELRYLLARGNMHLATDTIDRGARAFTLRVQFAADQKQAALELVAPDGIVERHEEIALRDPARLATLRAIAQRLPPMLGASGDWTPLIGTDDAKGYETFLACSLEVTGSQGTGFTSPPAKRPTRCIERMETLTRAQPKFARAWSALSLGYLSVGGKDAASLVQLAATSAERAQALDVAITDAYAGVGLVHFARNNWVSAQEQLDRALKLDAMSPAALEGLACLHADAGRYAAARPFAERAVALQSRNAGARECLAYASSVATSGKDPKADPQDDPPALRVQALGRILDGNTDEARRLLRSALTPSEFDLWAEPVLRASGNRQQAADALRAITVAANEAQIDASTELLCGVALRRADFVFNRIARMQREHEHVPLRILWLPQSTWLRKHPRFEEVIAAAGLPALWQEHGGPDICASEPAVYGCKLRAASATPSKSPSTPPKKAPATAASRE